MHVDTVQAYEHTTSGPQANSWLWHLFVSAVFSIVSHREGDGREKRLIHKQNGQILAETLFSGEDLTPAFLSGSRQRFVL